MALLWCDGFESYGDSTGNSITPTTIMFDKYLYEDTGYLPTVIEGRDGSGTYALQINLQGIRFATPHLTQNRTLIVGFAFSINAANSTNYTSLVSFRDPSLDGQTLGLYQAWDLEIVDNSELRIMRGSTTVNTTSGLGLTTNTWYELEMKVYCDTSSGTYEVIVDGVSVLSGTGNTQYSSSYNYYSKVVFHGSSGTNQFSIDDLYILDGSGNTNNDFLGQNMKVRDIRPDADASGNWTANGGGSSYSEVNSATQNSSKFVAAASSGLREIFEYSTFTLDGLDEIKGVMVTTEAVTDYTKTLGIKTVSQQGTGTINDGTTYPVLGTNNASLTGAAITEPYDYDPDGNSWNATLLAGVRFGVEAV